MPPRWLEKATCLAQANTERFDLLSDLAGLSRESDFRFTDLTDVDFAMSDLSGFDFTGARLTGCSFVGARLMDAIFDQAELGHINSRDNVADLTRALDYSEFAMNWQPSPNVPIDLSHIPIGTIYFFVPNMARIRGAGPASEDAFANSDDALVDTLGRRHPEDKFIQSPNAATVVKVSSDARRRATLPKYLTYLPKGFDNIELVRDVADVDESIVDRALARIALAAAKYTATNSPAVDGNRVIVAGQIFVKDAAGWTRIRDGTFKNAGVILGSQTAPPGFEEALIGTTPGATKLVHLTFPENYRTAELAGKPALLETRVVRVEHREEQQLDDKFAKEAGYDNLAAIRNKLRSAAEMDLLAASKKRLKRRLLDWLDEQNKFEAPIQMVIDEQEALWSARLEELELRNLTLESLGKSADEAKAELRPLADRRVRLGLVMSQLAILAARDGFTVTDEDIEKAAATYTKRAQSGPGDAEGEVAEENPKEMVRGPLLEDAVTDWLLSGAKISNRTVSANDLFKELSWFA